MNQELLCTWLGLPGNAWPPDHYTLLGLKAGELDLQRIERQVQERMAKLRCYQLSHPEEATEGMNRVAQAFISLTEAATKAARPAEPPRPNGTPAPAAQDNGKKSRAPVRPKVPDDTAVVNKTRLDWRNAPPPVRTATADPPAPPTAAPATSLSVDDRSALIRELAHYSSEARAGLGTLPALIDRIDQTRLLLVAWQRLGICLRKSQLSTTAENADFAQQLTIIRDVIDAYPAFVGHPGKPGYRVVAMARLSMTFAMFRNMDAGQCDDLLRDWNTGQRLLLEHRRYLRQRFKVMRRQSQMGLVWRAVSGALNDHPLLAGAGAVSLIALVVVLRLWVL